MYLAGNTVAQADPSVPFPNGEQLYIGGGEFKLTNLEHHLRFDATDGVGNTHSTFERRVAQIDQYFPLFGALFAIEKKQQAYGRPTITSITMPNVEGLNSFKRAELEPLGANNFSFAYGSEGEAMDDAFSAEQIIDALADRTFLLGAVKTPSGDDDRSPVTWLEHDIRDHGISLVLMHKTPADFLQKIAQWSIGLRETDPQLARGVAEVTVRALDTQTEAHVAMDTLPILGSYVLSAIIDGRYKVDPIAARLSELGTAAQPHLIHFFKQRGKRLTYGQYGQKEVEWERKNLPTYYARVSAKLAEKPRGEMGKRLTSRIFAAVDSR